MACMALGTSWGEESGRPLPPPPLEPEGWQPTCLALLSPYLSEQAYAHATQVAKVLPTSVECLANVAKQEDATTTV